jgi:hypothetical protein
MRRGVLLMVLLVSAVAACTDTKAPKHPAGAGGGASCLDSPTALRPPDGQLPCELIPPGVVLPR